MQPHTNAIPMILDTVVCTCTNIFKNPKFSNSDLPVYVLKARTAKKLSTGPY